MEGEYDSLPFMSNPGFSALNKLEAETIQHILSIFTDGTSFGI